MGKNLKRIGISGGTFNPIHKGHLKIAQEIKDRLLLGKVLFVPSGMPPHKDLKSVTEPVHRFNMVKRAIEGIPWFEASSIEIDRDGYTYTVDTLKELRGIYGTQAELYYIIGADVVSELTTWKNFTEVFGLCKFVAVMRPGYRREDFNSEIEFLEKSYGAKIHPLEASLIDVSSTMIRNYLKEGLSVTDYVPGGVDEYIRKNGLYK